MARSAEDPNYTPRTGATPDGLPLSINRAPRVELDPWIARMMVAMIDMPGDAVMHGHLCNDAGYVRTVMDASWTAATLDAEWQLRDASYLFGQHRRAMKISCKGPVVVAGFMLRPGAMHAIWGLEDGRLLDDIQPAALAGIDEAALTGLYRPGIDGESWLCRIEDWLCHEIERREARKPEPLSQRFELAAFSDPNIGTGEFCEANGITLKQLQRICKRDFGLSPKFILRRARVLDLAARMCGVADEAEEEEFLLRYFDQSHLIREFAAFFGRTPQQFMRDRQPFLTLSLEVRQARRLELLHRIAPGAVRPWMRKEFQPPLSRKAS